MSTHLESFLWGLWTNTALWWRRDVTSQRRIDAVTIFYYVIYFSWKKHYSILKYRLQTLTRIIAMTSTDGFLSQIISNAENVSMAWRHLSILMFQYTNPDYAWCGFHVSLAYTIVKYDPWSIPLRRSPHFHLFNGRSLTLRRHEATSPAATAYIGIWRRQKDRQSNLIENSIRVRNLVDTASMRSTRHKTLAQRYKTAMIFESQWVGVGRLF